MDIVDELFDSDAASALTNRAAREIARLRDLIEVLRGGRQCDEDGTEIIMSRQACHEAADEIARLRDENESLRGSLEEWKLDLNSLRDENAKLREDQDECDALRSKLTDILTGTANALKGEPGELQVHSWHDVPEWAQRARDENVSLLVELNVIASTLPGSYYMDPPDGGSVTVAEQVARMAKDAARYRHLRNSHGVTMQGHDFWKLGPDLDYAIDAAMQKEE